MNETKRLSACSEQETIQFLSESLKQGADIARQLARLQGKQKWFQIAQLLEKIHHKGMEMANAKALSRIDTLVLLDVERRKLGAEEAKKPSVH